MADYSKKNGTKAYDFETVTDEELNEDKDLAKAVLTDMIQIGRDAKLHGFELPKGTKKICLHFIFASNYTFSNQDDNSYDRMSHNRSLRYLILL